MSVDETLSFSVLTLNVWGLYLVSKKRTERISELCKAIKSMRTVNVVCLQEVWVDADAELLLEAGKEAGLSYGVHFRSGTFGSGLVTLSRYPILASWFQMYSSAGDPGAIFCGDYFAKKGVGWARLETPSGFIIDVFNTHLHANYSHKYQHTNQLRPSRGTQASVEQGSNSSKPSDAPDASQCTYRVPYDGFACYRVSQMFELTQFISRHALLLNSAPGTRAGIVLAGDLNSKPDTLEIEMLKGLLPLLKDSWSTVHGPNEPGYTCKAPGNTFDPKRQVPERIDYVWTTLDIKTCHTALHQTPLGFSYSDHFAVDATVALQAPDAKAGHLQGANRLALPPCVVADTLDVLQRGVVYNIRNVHRRRMYGMYGLVSVLLGAVLALSAAGYDGGDSELGTNAEARSSVVMAVASGLGMVLVGGVTVILAFVCSWLGDSCQARVLTQQILQFSELVGKSLAFANINKPSKDN